MFLQLLSLFILIWADLLLLFLYRKKVKIINKLVDDVNFRVDKVNDLMIKDFNDLTFNVFNKYKVNPFCPHKKSEYVFNDDSLITTGVLMILFSFALIIFSLYTDENFIFAAGILVNLVYCWLFYLLIENKKEGEEKRYKMFS